MTFGENARGDVDRQILVIWILGFVPRVALNLYGPVARCGRAGELSS